MKINIDHLRYLRQHSGRSIRQLAKDARVSHSHLAYIEAGKREPSEKIVMKLASTLEVPIDTLVNG